MTLAVLCGGNVPAVHMFGVFVWCLSEAEPGSPANLKESLGETKAFEENSILGRKEEKVRVLVLGKILE